MSDPGGAPDVPDSLQPVFECAFEEPFVMYEGPLRATQDITVLDGEGQVYWQWRPSPKVLFRFASPQLDRWTGLGGDGDLRVAPVGDFNVGTLVATLWNERPPAGVTAHSGGELPPTRFGDGRALSRLVIHLVNLDDWMLPDPISDGTTWSRGRLVMSTGEWHVTIDKIFGAHDELKQVGGYAFTHVVEIRPDSGRTFDVEELDELRNALWLLLSFANGSLVGFALPVGFDVDGKPCWTEWSVTTADVWRNRLSWFDYEMAPDLEALLREWLRRSSDPFWRDVLRRAVRFALAANDPSPLDVAVVVTQSALELLAWSVLVIDQEWLDAKTFNSVDVGAAAKIRLLLRWAGIDPHIPTQLSDLHAATKGRGMLDAADAIVWVRNRIAHPPRRYKGGPLEWPQRELADTWRLGLEYVELVLLRVLGHQGKYGSRLHVDGRWPNDTTPVPWQPARTGTRATQEPGAPGLTKGTPS